MVFIKLVVLILVCGSSGIGLLSVRQSRLQAAHEMAEARHRVRRLDELAGEIRAAIAQDSTPDRVAAMIEMDPRFEPAIKHPAQLAAAAPQTPAADETMPASEPVLIAQASSDPISPVVEIAPAWVDPARDDMPRTWILDDGSRVIFVDVIDAP